MSTKSTTDLSLKALRSALTNLKADMPLDWDEKEVIAHYAKLGISAQADKEQLEKLKNELFE